MMDRMREKNIEMVAAVFLELEDEQLRDAMKFRSAKEIYDDSE